MATTWVAAQPTWGAWELVPMRSATYGCRFAGSGRGRADIPAIKGREVLYQVEADRLDQATRAMAELAAQ
jgi:hypothetical protein